MQVIAAPDGWPIWVSPVRPGREHDTTCARAHGLVDALNRLAATLGIPTLTDLGHENAERTLNAIIRGVHGVAERANALLKVTFKDGRTT
ncbi:hypothetical protein QFZ76_007512 [Streptomyces sp. V4I2]|nr:hypothetical protein [Streptomyces sp. V4I2]